jgi:membrane protease YdiL (CAAX protease family)
MENETKVPPPAPEEKNLVRTHFHLTLGLIFVPVVAVAVGWTLAISDVFRGYSSAAELRWMRYFVALVVMDVLVTASVIWMVANPEVIERAARTPAAAPGPRIGIGFDPDLSKDEPLIRQVLPGSPAERAGLQPDDLVEKIDGDPVTTRKEIQESIRSGAAGTARVLTIRRGEITMDVSVVPELPPAKERKGLFEVRPASSKEADWRGVLLTFLPAVAVVAIAALLSRLRRGAGVAVWRGFLMASVGSFAASIGSAYLFHSMLGGWTLGGMLISLLVQMASLLGLTQLATAWCGRDVPPPPDPLPPLTPTRAALQGLFYLVTGFLRVSILLWTADQIFFQGASSAKTQGLEVLATSPLGVWGTLLFVFVVVFLGPFAEELLFRGFLVPRLAARWGSGAALLVSSLIFALFHPHYRLFMPVVFLYGYVFGWARLRTGGIAASVLMHTTVNGLVSALMLLH